jgi:hypothetical protein
MEPIPTTYTPEMSFLSMNIRSRREISTRDSANIRQFEHWQTDGPYLQYDRPDLNGPKILNDMNPTNSRKVDSKQYLQNRPMKAGQDSFSKNPYFEGYSPVFDPRNAIREVRSAIYEDRFDKGMKESKRLLARSFTNTWEKEDWVQTQNLDTLKAYESLKPQMNEMEKTFRHSSNESNQKNTV